MRLHVVLALAAAPIVAAFTPSAAPALRPVSARAALSARAATRRPARVSALSMNKDSAEIDFGEVGFKDADSQFSGMVFKPEVGSEPESRCRVDWHAECEKALNDHINVEYTASYAYHALFSYFDRDTVGLQGFASFFEQQSLEERGHAKEFMEYQNTRGGQVRCPGPGRGRGAAIAPGAFASPGPCPRCIASAHEVLSHCSRLRGAQPDPLSFLWAGGAQAARGSQHAVPAHRRHLRRPLRLRTRPYAGRSRFLRSH